eukprot:Rmarinus@m.12564
MANSIEDWFNGLPLVTKNYFISAVSVTLAANFGLISWDRLYWDIPLIMKFQLWRLITPFLVLGGLGFSLLIVLMMLVRYSQALEQGIFAGRPADYLFCLIFCAISLIGLNFLIPMPFMGQPLVYALVYVWSRHNPDTIVSFMFGLRFQALYLPWILAGFHMLLGSSPMPYLMGIASGHVYFYLDHIYPNTSGRRLLHTPQFLEKLVGGRSDWYAGPRRQQGGGGENGGGGGSGHSWGTGHRLGSN